MPKTLDELEKLFSDLGASLVTLREEMALLAKSRASSDDLKSVLAKIDAAEKRMVEFEGKLPKPAPSPTPSPDIPSYGFWDPRAWMS